MVMRLWVWYFCLCLGVGAIVGKCIHSALAFAILVAFVVQSSAQTIGYADALDMLAAACGADVQKYCKNVNLGNNRINNCLEQHQSNISFECKKTRADVFTLLQKRANAQASVRGICDADIRSLCPGVVQEDGYLLECGLKAWRSLGDKCRQAITDAGWH